MNKVQNLNDKSKFIYSKYCCIYGKICLHPFCVTRYGDSYLPMHKLLRGLGGKYFVFFKFCKRGGYKKKKK